VIENMSESRLGRRASGDEVVDDGEDEEERDPDINDWLNTFPRQLSISQFLHRPTEGR
jgi:hypothetical protein